MKPAPVRWVLRLYGAETDKESGMQKLQLTATKGHYLLPFARLLLAVAALRDNQRSDARELLSVLAQEFPTISFTGGNSRASSSDCPLQASGG